MDSTKRDGLSLSQLEARLAADAAEREWRPLREAILASGGIRVTAEFDRDRVPASLYRRRGLAPDEVGLAVCEVDRRFLELGGDATLAELGRVYDGWRRAQDGLVREHLRLRGARPAYKAGSFIGRFPANYEYEEGV